MIIHWKIYNSGITDNVTIIVDTSHCRRCCYHRSRSQPVLGITAVVCVAVIVVAVVLLPLLSFVVVVPVLSAVVCVAVTAVRLAHRCCRDSGRYGLRLVCGGMPQSLLAPSVIIGIAAVVVVTAHVVNCALEGLDGGLEAIAIVTVVGVMSAERLSLSSSRRRLSAQVIVVIVGGANFSGLRWWSTPFSSNPIAVIEDMLLGVASAITYHASSSSAYGARKCINGGFSGPQNDLQRKVGGIIIGGRLAAAQVGNKMRGMKNIGRNPGEVLVGMDTEEVTQGCRRQCRQPVDRDQLGSGCQRDVGTLLFPHFDLALRKFKLQ
ncbi:hypothetical protein EDB84DRAFT_1674343 [Lactarius hengduanensis]|nr:hypothetical protein EDB84DRAFT_1674343 [Lactarius hengduanensis]